MFRAEVSDHNLDNEQQLVTVAHTAYFCKQAQIFQRRKLHFPYITGPERCLGTEIVKTVVGRTDFISRRKQKTRPFDAHKFLESAGVARTIVRYGRLQRIYAQGDPATSVLYIQEGGVKLSVVSAVGKEAIVALLGPGDFFGEGCLAGLPFRMGAATAITPTTVLVVRKKEMMRVLHKEHKLSDLFIAYLLTRNIRVEEDLVDQLFNSIEKRLARTLLLLARYGKADRPQKLLPKISQETLAEMVGTTRPRVSVFMNKFRKLGFIHYNGGLQVHDSLLNVILHE
jgi:CRP/FNR family cyclic AMP-dependent transcriptional regulator